MDAISFTPGDIVALCNFILVIAAVGALALNAAKRVNRPNEIQDEKIEEIRNRMTDHDKQFNDIRIKLDHDKKRLDEIESVSRVTNRVIIQTLQVLVRHGIDGNNKEELVEADKELNKYLLNERWGHDALERSDSK